ncbi:MAG: hypothetical protein K2L86_11605 [Lachnospiraceae bacterium]|nr:hypothetical protein [Lachnospiraceae bacterium]
MKRLKTQRALDITVSIFLTPAIPSVFLSLQRIRKYCPFSMTWEKLL